MVIVHRAKEMPPFFAAFSQLPGRGLNQELDATLLGQHRLAVIVLQGVNIVVPVLGFGCQRDPCFENQRVGVDDTHTPRMFPPNETNHLLRIGCSPQQLFQELRVLVIADVQDLKAALNRSALVSGLIVQDAKTKSHVVRGRPAKNAAGFGSGLTHSIRWLVL